MTPTETLRDEHRVILEALVVLDAAAHRLATHQPVPEEEWQARLEWLRVFVDGRHHAKEETMLFPAMIAAGVPSGGGPIDVMLEEHELGRGLVASMAHGQPAQRAAQARDYVRLLREHIDKENAVLFPLADAMLDVRALERLGRDFASADLERASVEDAERMLDALGARRPGRVPPRCA